MEDLSSEFLHSVFYMGAVACLLALLAAISSATNKYMFLPLRQITTSLSVGNLFLCTYVVIRTHYDKKGLQYVESVRCSVPFALTHLACLSVAEFSVEANRAHNTKRSINGLICLAWVLSAPIAGLVYTFGENAQRQVASNTIYVSFVAFVIFYATKMRWLRANRLKGDKLRIENLRDETETSPEIYLPRILLIIYYVCAFPLAIGQHVDKRAENSHSFLSSVYVMHWIIFSTVILVFKLRSNFTKRFTV